MNQALIDGTLNIDLFDDDDDDDQLWDSPVDEKTSKSFDTQFHICRECRGVSFENASDLEQHIIGHHVKDVQVLLQRLTDAAIQRLSQRRRRPRKGAFAIKRSHSYFVPRVKGGKKGSLKLKLKVSGDSDSRSFEVVPVQKVLVGPGDLYPLNGGDFDQVKTEHFLTDVEWEKSLEGSSEQPEVASSGERTLNEEPDSNDKENSWDSDKSNEDEPGDDVVNDDTEENKDDDNGDLLTIGKEELDIPPSPAPTPSSTPLPNIPSPEPESATSPLGIPSDPASDALNSPSNEELESEFLPQESDIEYSQSPNMVEINNSTVADVRSPGFPTTSSPATPGQPTPPSDQQTSQSAEGHSDEEISESQDISNSEQLQCDDSSNGATTGNFVWTDVSGNDTDIAGDESNNQSLEERDPLLLNDPSASATDQGGSLQDSPNSASIDGSDQSILRGFLAEHNSDRSSGSVAGGLESFNSLGGSEYISLERLGDNAVLCDVCGERAADQSALQDHKFRAGHFKCSQPECGGVIYATAEELMAHQQNVHGSQQFSQQNILNQSQPIMNQQSAPVQQLVQQVQRLPVPQMSMQALNKTQPPHTSAIPQQLASNMVTLIPSQQNQFQAAVCRPPPLYPAPGPNMMQQQHPGAPPPYPSHQAQMMFPQPYPPHSQSFATSPRQPMQMQPRPYSAMMQQINQNTMRHQAPRVQVANVQQRGLTAQSVGSSVGSPGGKRTIQGSPNSPSNKQRRMDMLIPDRHDDADCHVIAMQKRTDSGPLITGVQGSTSSAQSGVPSSRQSQGDSTINLTDSITLSVRGQTANPPNGGKSRNDANSVASLLATRGITVTPAGASGRGNPNQVQAQSPHSPHRQVNNRQPPTSVPAPPPPQPPPQPVTTLNLNSAISIIPTASVRTPPKPQQLQQQQQSAGNFAVPQGRSAGRPQQQAQVERPPRPPTVDLTGDGPPPPPALNPMGGRGRGRGRGMMGRNVCQLCDKQFATLDALNQHMVTHRPGKLPFRCNMCTAQYPTQQGLLQHRQTYHKESPSQMNSELVLPVVDLKSPATINRLNSLGVRHYIPLSQLSNQSGGVLGLPLVVLEGGRTATGNLAALGAATILTLGPLRQLPR